MNDTFREITPKMYKKPWAQLLIGFYFFPLVISLFFLNAKDIGNAGLALSILVVIFFSTLLFLTLKKWERTFFAWIRKALFQLEELAAQKAGEDPAVSENRLLSEVLRQKEEEIAGLTMTKQQMAKEFENSIKEYEKSFQKQEEKIVQLHLKMKEVELAQNKAQQELADAQSLLRSKEERIVELGHQIADLNFEIRIMLKISQPTERAVLMET